MNNLFKWNNKEGSKAYGSGSAAKGFTLAEVLMTLGLVGVIAVVTMTTLIPNIQNAELKTTFKTVYSDVAQVTSKIMTDNGNSLKDVFPYSNTMRDKYKEYLNTLKSCDKGQSFGNCWHNSGSFKYLNGNPITGWGDKAGIVLNNGTLLRFQVDSSNCTALAGTVPYCGFISIDVNGWQSPNVLGKDIYHIWVQENGIKPRGTKGDTYENTCNTTSVYAGTGCAAKVLMGQ
ncbi:MAG: type II secretion system protein [bacterium]